MIYKIYPTKNTFYNQMLLFLIINRYVHYEGSHCKFLRSKKLSFFWKLVFILKSKNQDKNYLAEASWSLRRSSVADSQVWFPVLVEMRACSRSYCRQVWLVLSSVTVFNQNFNCFPPQNIIYFFPISSFYIFCLQSIVKG